MNERNLKGLHILIYPDFQPDEFFSVLPRLTCQEVILFLPETFDSENWEKTIREQIKINLKVFRYSKENSDGFSSIYELGSYISSRNVYLCSNSKDPLIYNIIFQNVTISLVSEFSSDDFLTIVQYSLEEEYIYVMPVFPYWKDNCRFLFELLIKIEEEKTKNELLEEINLVNPEFTINQLEEALSQLEKSMIGYSGFIKGRRGHANTYNLQPIIEI